MATKGLRLPVKTAKSGGIDIEKETSELDKILRLALSEGDDHNPFQDIGIMPRIIYSINDMTTASEARLEVKRILKKFG